MFEGALNAIILVSPYSGVNIKPTLLTMSIEEVLGSQGNPDAESHTGVVGNMSLTPDMQFNTSHILSISGYSVLFTLSSIGNLNLLVRLLRVNKQKSLSRINLLLVHLAVADLMVTFLMMPLEIGWAATVEWKAGDVLCRSLSFFRIFGLYLSIFVLVCIAIDRYMAIAHPMQGLRSTNRVKILLFIAWLVSSVCTFPQVIIFHVESHPDFPDYKQCVNFNSFPKKGYELMYTTFCMLMMYVFPVILLFALYGSITLELRHVLNSSKVVAGSTDGLRRIGSDNIYRAKVKSIKMTFVITAVFLLCWTPYYAMCLWYWFFPESAKHVNQLVQKSLFLFSSANVTVNPVVYGIFHSKSFSQSPKHRVVGVDKRGNHRTQFIRRNYSLTTRPPSRIENIPTMV